MPILRNKKHEDFAWMVANGKTPTEAYRLLYPNAKPSSVEVASSRLMKNVKVQLRIEEIQCANAADRERVRNQLLTTLATVAIDGKPITDTLINSDGKQTAKTIARSWAIEQMNKMLGLYEPTKSTHDVTTNGKDISPSSTFFIPDTKEEYDAWVKMRDDRNERK